MENSNFNKQYEIKTDDLNSMMLILLIVSIVLYVITSGGRAMKFMFIMVRALQIIMHLPLIQVLFPANIMMIIKALFPTIGFDIMDSVLEWEDQSLVEFNFKQHDTIKDKVFNQLVDIGYDSFNSIMILQTLGVIVLFYFIQVLFCAQLLLFVRITKNKYGGQKRLENLSKNLFFNPLIELYIQGFFEFVISAILTFSISTNSMFGEVLSYILGIWNLFMTALVLPASLIGILFVKSELLKDESFIQRFGQLYSNMNYEKKPDNLWARAYFLIFILRRWTFILVCFALSSNPII